METLKILLHVFLIWTLFGTAWGGIEFMLDRWEKMSPRTINWRVLLYGPLAWLLGFFVWGYVTLGEISKASTR